MIGFFGQPLICFSTLFHNNSKKLFTIYTLFMYLKYRVFNKNIMNIQKMRSSVEEYRESDRG